MLRWGKNLPLVKKNSWSWQKIEKHQHVYIKAPIKEGDEEY
jgi:hypothetical protein